MRYALHTYRAQMRKNAVKRGVTRKYNRTGEHSVIVTVRLTQTEYDALHFVAASVRISVSLLVYLIITNWRRWRNSKRKPQVCLIYSYQVPQWNSAGGTITESLTFGRRTLTGEFTLQDIS